MYPATTSRRRSTNSGGHLGYSDPYGPGSVGFLADQSVMKKLRLRIDNDDPLFPALKKLKIRGKDLNDLPPEVFEITELEVLDLSPEREACIDYQLTSVPAQIGQLVNLRVLMLDTNHLTELPSEIGSLVLVERLSISNNHIRRLPDTIARLTQLESFHAANNRFETFPLVVCDLRALRFLDLSDNLLSELPEEIARLQRLEALLLVFNRLTHLPHSICSMVNLHLLWLGSNRLRKLPPDFGQLLNLDWGFRHTSSSVIDGNPLEEPPVEVCKQGAEAIASYFDRLQPDDEDPHARGRRRRHESDDEDMYSPVYDDEYDADPAPTDDAADYHYGSDRRRRLH